MGELEKFTSLPIEPVYRQAGPNETVVIGRVGVQVEHGGASREDTAKVAMTFMRACKKSCVS